MIVKILKLLSLTYIITYISLLMIGSIKKIKVSNLYFLLTIIFALSVALWGYFLEPSIQMDLFRLQKHVDFIKNYPGNFWQKMMPPDYEFTAMITFNLLCYIVGCLDDVHFMSFISVFIVVAVICTLIIKYIQKNNYSSRCLLIAYILVFTGMQLQYVFSGIRNSMAIALTSLAFWIFAFSNIKNRMILSGILYFLAIMMHPMVLLVLVVYLLSRFPKQIIVRILALGSLPLIFNISSILTLLPIGLFNYIGQRLLFYNQIAYEYDRPEVVANITIFLVVGGSYFFYRRFNDSNTVSIDFLNFYYLTGFLMIGTVMHRDITLRIGYVMGLASIPLVMEMINSNSKRMKFIKKILYSSILICSLKVFFDTFIVFSQWKFN